MVKKFFRWLFNSDLGLGILTGITVITMIILNTIYH